MTQAEIIENSSTLPEGGIENKDDILEQLRQCEMMYHKYAF